MSNEPTKMSAAARLENVENAMFQSFQTTNQLANDTQLIKEALKLLGNKVDAIVKATIAGQPLTDEVLTSIMVSNNVADLESKVATLRSQGFLVPEEAATTGSFIVGREVTAEGKVANPRLQFALSSVNEELRSKIAGSKAGDVLVLEEGKLSFEVLETYEIRNPQAPQPEAEA